MDRREQYGQEGDGFIKRVISLLLVLLAAGTVLSARAEDAAARQCGDYRYALAGDGTAVITGYSGTDAALSVPSELDGHTVKGIGDGAFKECDCLTAITLPDCVRVIREVTDDDAFSNHSLAKL